VVQEAGPIQTRLGLVAAGFGVHVVPQAWRSMPFPGVAYVPTRPAITLRMAAWWRKGNPNPMLRLLLAALQRHRHGPRAGALPHGPADAA
jgi:hypothetical protein